MPARKLMRSMVEKLDPGPALYEVQDTVVKGLSLRVSPSGVKAYTLRYRPKGGGRGVNPRRIPIGRHPAITPEQARDIAIAALAEVAAGRDPAPKLHAASQTVGEILDAYATSLKGRASYRVVESDVRLHLKPAFGRILIAGLTAERVREFHQRLTRAGTVRRAGACITTLRTALRRAGVDPAPAMGVKATTWRRRRRAASLDELRRFFVACDDALASGEVWPWAVYLFLLLVFTGARPAEIRTARWSDVDLGSGQLVRREHKTAAKGEDRVIELTDPALRILERIPRITGSPYLIPGKRPGEPLKIYDKPWRWIKERAGLGDLWVYDLRRTFASMGLGAGLSLAQIGKALGHSHASTTDGYAWLQPTDRRRVAETIGSALAALASHVPATPPEDRGDT